LTKSSNVVCITGPESSGKTTLSNALSKKLNAVEIPELAREHLENTKGVYSKADLIPIAAAQLEAIRSNSSSNKSLVISDTGVEVVKIWHEVKFGNSAELDSMLLKQFSLVSSYILCSPEIPWEADPLRENPTNRDELFSLYITLLKKHGLNFTVVKGNKATRVDQALKFLELKKPSN